MVQEVIKKVFQFSSNLEKKRKAGSLRIKKLSSFRKKNKLSLVVQKLTTLQIFIIEYDKIKHIVLISRTRYTYSCSSRSYITVMECKKSLKCLYESKVILLRIASCLDPPLKSNNWNNLHTCVSFKLFTPQKPDKFLSVFLLIIKYCCDYVAYKFIYFYKPTCEKIRAFEIRL